MTLQIFPPPLSGAIAQSGGTLLNFAGTMGTHVGGKAEVNDKIAAICGHFTGRNGCDNTTAVEKQVQQLKLG